MKAQDSYSVTNSGIATLLIEYNELEVCTDISVNKGWNIISVPLEASDMTKSFLFPNSSSSAFGYDNGYVSTQEMEVGKGYWLKFDSQGELQVCGLPVNKSIQVKSGWNIIGPFDTDVPISQITTTPQGIIASNYFGFDGTYFFATTLTKGKGYWVKASQDGEISFESDGNTQIHLAKNNEIEPFLELPIVINNGMGDTVSLFVGIDSTATDSLDQNLGEEELPPLPPPAVLDARLNIPGTNNISVLKDFRFGPETNQFERNYQVQYQPGEGTEIRLSWDLPSGLTLRIQDVVTGSVIDTAFEDGIDSLTVTNPDGISKLNLIVTYPANGVVGIKDIALKPTDFRLFQNYPNPFNPRTVIKYALPVESSVNIKIFNTIGRKVSEFNEGIKAAGYHQITWHPNNLSSGVYFYTITVTSSDGKSNFIKTQKMILMK